MTLKGWRVVKPQHNQSIRKSERDGQMDETDAWADAQKNNIALSHTFTMKESRVASLVKFRPVV